MFRFHDSLILLPDSLQARSDNLPANLKLGIRPTHISASLNPETPHDVQGEVFVTENMQDWCIVSVDAADTRLQVMVSPSFNARRHERIYLKFNQDYMRFFDEEKAVY